jgi:hypothetical protein
VQLRELSIRWCVQALEAEEAVRKELQWESERARLALEKLRAAFLDDIEVERIVLRAFRSSKYVTTFRTAKLTARVQVGKEACRAHKPFWVKSH